MSDKSLAVSDLKETVHPFEADAGESFFSLIVATMREGVWFLDSNGITTYVNRSMALMLGWSESEMLGRSLFDFMDEKAVQHARNYMDRRRSGISEVHEFRFRHRDGRDVWTTLSTRSLHNVSGKFQGTMATIQDITPQKLVEEELRSRKQQLRQMLDQLPLMTWSVDSSLRVTSSYGSGLKEVGLENNQLVGLTLEEHLSSWDLEKAEAMMSAHQRAIAGETVFMEIEFLQRFNFNIISPYFDKDNATIIGAIGVALDVTEQTRTQQNLEKSENLLRSIFKSAPDAILTVDESGRIISFNDSAFVMFGLTQTEIEKIKIQQLVEVGMPCDSFNHFLEMLEIPGVGCFARKTHGELIPVEISSSRVGSLSLWTLMLRDVSRLRELQRQVVSIAEDQQRKLGREIHDDVGQELTGVNLLVDALRSDLEKVNQADELNRLAGIVRQRLKRTQSLIRSISHGLLVSDLDTEGLYQAISSLADSITDLHGVRCQWKSPARPVRLPRDSATQLFRIAQEATSNALRHSRASVITMEIVADDSTGEIELRISDNGKGLAHDQSQHDGMGMRIMKYRAGLIGGSLRVETGKGLVVICRVRELRDNG